IAENPYQLLGSPAVLLARLDDQRLGEVARPMRARVRRPAPVHQAGAAARAMTREPFVPRRSCHTIALTQLGHRPLPTLVVRDESEPLVQHMRFHPRHPLGVNDVAGLVSTMNPVYTGD